MWDSKSRLYKLKCYYTLEDNGTIWKVHLPSSFQLMQMPENSCRVLRHVHGFCHYGHASLQVNKCHPSGLSLEAHKSCFSLLLHWVIWGKLSQVRKDEATHLADLSLRSTLCQKWTRLSSKRPQTLCQALGVGSKCVLVYCILENTQTPKNRANDWASFKVLILTELKTLPALRFSWIFQLSRNRMAFTLAMAVNSFAGCYQHTH